MEIAIISGKGGTGKSMVSAAFATISKNILLADCDVDAANLHILFEPKIEHERTFVSGYKAVIDRDLCSDCEICIDYCRFDAIDLIDGEVRINEIRCDGCQLCERVCPVAAISMRPEDRSRLYSGDFRNGKMVFGRLAPGEENSGQLVDMVREEATSIAKKYNLKTTIIDGPPGIGCPVLSTITGVDYVVIVTEPTLSGMHDLKRSLEIVKNFELALGVIINKYDLNEKISKMIVDYLEHKNIDVIAELPFDRIVVDAMVACESLYEFAPNAEITNRLIDAYQKIHES